MSEQPIEQPPPENNPVTDDHNELDFLEFDLPVSEELPPSEVQARLEEPTGYHWVDDGFGVQTLVETEPATPPGVVAVWTEPDLEAITRALEEAGEDEATAGTDVDDELITDQAVSATGGTP